MCHVKKLFIALLLCCVCSFVYAQDVQVNLEQELAVTSSSISANLVNLKVQSETMKQLLMIQSERLERYEIDQKIWEQQSMELSSSLDSINNSLNSSYETITRYETKLKIQCRVLAVLLIAIVIRIVSMLIGYILYIRGIKVPRWLDILL